jgi:hypothetical protein
MTLFEGCEMNGEKFVPGKLKLKGKGKSGTSSRNKEEKGEKLGASTEEKVDIADGLTEAEARFMLFHNKYKKKVIEQKMSVGYRAQREKLNEKLKSLPMHNDLEGE